MEGLIISVAVSIDAFASGLMYGSKKIWIPLLCSVIIGLVSCVSLVLSLLLGAQISVFLSPEVCAMLSGVTLVIIGGVKLFDSQIKSFIAAYNFKKNKCDFMISILKIYANPSIADKDNSKSLSAKEAIPLSFAIALDCIATGLGAGLNSPSVWEAFVLTFIFTLLFIYFGLFLGKKTSKIKGVSLDWLGGALLMTLGIMKLI